jgi:hypothetical protein
MELVAVVAVQAKLETRMDAEKAATDLVLHIVDLP